VGDFVVCSCVLSVLWELPGPERNVMSDDENDYEKSVREGQWAKGCLL
jgi:hypothetical protein